VSSRLPRDAELAAALGLFLVCWGLVHTWFWAHGQIVDTPTYQAYGDAIVHHGRVPYRDFAVEYPPGALPVFALPSLFGDYPAAFAWVMAACGIALVAVSPARWYVALAPVLVGSLILSRFDLWPALLAAAALVVLARERDAVGWGLLGAAIAAKLWPVALVPLALAWSWRRGRRVAILAGPAVLGAIVLPFAILAPHGLWTSLRGQLSRPLQIESLPASLLATFGHPRVVSSHGSQNIAGHALAGTVETAALVAVLLGLWLAFARGAMEERRLVRYAAACVCAVVVLDKVLSPQYLIWLVPLVPLVRGRRGIAAVVLLTAALVLTQVWFPARYWAYATHFHLAGVVLARNLALLALLAVLAWPESGVKYGRRFALSR
jgi:hypothetical protein